MSVRPLAFPNVQARRVCAQTKFLVEEPRGLLGSRHKRDRREQELPAVPNPATARTVTQAACILQPARLRLRSWEARHVEVNTAESEDAGHHRVV
jgi:hypothetical protein